MWGTWFERRKYFHHIIKSTSPRTPYPHVPGVLTVCLCLSPEQLSRQPVGTTQCKRCPPSMSSTAPCPQPGRVCEGWGRIHLHMLFIGLRATACPSSHGVLTPRCTGPLIPWGSHTPSHRSWEGLLSPACKGNAPGGAGEQMERKMVCRTGGQVPGRSLPPSPQMQSPVSFNCTA